MNTRKPQAKLKMADVTRMKKDEVEPTAPELNINARSMAKPEIKVSAPAGTDIDTASDAPDTVAPAYSAPKRTVIEPLGEPSGTQAKAETETAAKTDATTNDEDTSPVTSTPAKAPETEVEEPKPATDAKQSEDTRKAVAEAQAAAKRKAEVENYIDSKQFFVPINAIARKRSIKVSFALIFVLVLLSALLIDLMIDSGLILLVQKIPHTHFFTN